VDLAMIAARLVVAGLSGALLAALAPPLNWHLLHWVAYLPMFWALREEQARSNRWLGYFYGVVAAGSIFTWLVPTISIFSNLPTALAIIVLGLYAMVFGLAYLPLWAMVHPMRRRFGVWWIVAWPAWQVVLEWVSTHLLLFPYGQGVTQYRVPLVWQIVSLTGVYGSTYILLLVNAAWGEALYRHREGRSLPWRPVAGVLLTLAAVMGFGKWRYEHVEAQLRDAPELRVAQLQTAQSMEERLQGFARESFDDWLELTSHIEPGSVDLVVWPEGACPYDLNQVGDKPNRPATVLGSLAKQGHFQMVVGGGTRLRDVDPLMGETRVRVFNSVYWFDELGQVVDHYDKMVPIPFGEYLPFGEYVPWLSEMIGGIGDFKAGDEPVVFERGGIRGATPICYEATLPAVCRRFPSPNLFINVTNDAWFGDTAAPHLHAMLAAIRATELGVPLVRSGYTGVSFIVEPHGAIHHETTPFTTVRRIVTVRHATAPTLYARWGDWFVAACALGLAAAWGTTRKRA